MKLNTKPTADVEFGFTVLAAGIYTARVSLTQKEKKDHSGENLVIAHQILDREVVSNDGKKIVNRGQFKVSRFVPTDSEFYDSAVKELAVACGHNGVDDIMTEDIEGKIVSVKLAVQPPKDQYSESNTVKNWKPVTDVQLEAVAGVPF